MSTRDDIMAADTIAPERPEATVATADTPVLRLDAVGREWARRRLEKWRGVDPFEDPVLMRRDFR